MELNINNILMATPEGFNTNLEDMIIFKSGLGLLIYLIVRTRPDIVFALYKLSIFSNNLIDTY